MRFLSPHPSPPTLSFPADRADVRRAADFTGISAPYEAPETPEIHIKTGECDVTEAVRRITEYLTEKKFI